MPRRISLTVENEEVSDDGGDESDIVGEESEDDEEPIVDRQAADTLLGIDWDEWEMTRLKAMEGASHKNVG